MRQWVIAFKQEIHSSWWHQELHLTVIILVIRSTFPSRDAQIYEKLISMWNSALTSTLMLTIKSLRPGTCISISTSIVSVFVKEHFYLAYLHLLQPLPAIPKETLWLGGLSLSGFVSLVNQIIWYIQIGIFSFLAVLTGCLCCWSLNAYLIVTCKCLFLSPHNRK